MTRFHATALLAGAALALVLSACGDSANATGPAAVVTGWPTPTPPPPGSAQPSASATATAAAPAGVGQAQSSGLGTPAQNVAATAQLAFDPTAVTAKSSDVIQWKNTGSAPHNVTFDDQPSLTSGTLQQGDTWQVQFTTAGTYKYHCTFHPGMNGQITVGG